MQAPHHRKIELQSPADLTYLYANTVALSRQKLDLHLPPSADNDPDHPDPMRERVKELVDEFITQTFTYASSSISINGMDFDPSSSGVANSANNNKGPLAFSSAFTAPETVEYEPYDTALASRVTSLYAQLESLTTTVAQLRRDAPKRAAKTYADALTKALEEDEAGAERLDRQAERGARDQDVEMTDDTTTKTEDGTEAASSSSFINPAWKLQIPFGSDAETERWHNGEMAEIYSDTLRTLLRLQGEVVTGDDHADLEEGSRALATTVGKAERAGRAAEVVQKM